MKRIVTAIAAAALITGVPAAARAAPAHHHQAAAHPQVQILWYSQANNDDLWWPNHNYFTVNQTGGTALTPAGCNNGNYCEEMLPNGNCMTWDSGPNNVEELNCQGLDRQMWNFEYVGSATYIPSNLYANSAMPCSGYAAALREHGAGNNVDMSCPDASGHKYNLDEQWSDG